MIVAEALSKNYAGRRAIDDVSFRIGEGEIVGLLGLNGAGKSTILKILGCFLMPSGGKARVGGFAVDESPDEIRKIIGYLPDTPPLYDEMTVERYLNYVAKLKDVECSKVKARVEDVLERTNTREVRDYRLGELSHGFRQRVGIAQALVHDPRVLILDEPINGLDPVQIVEMRDLILSLKGRHTVVLSSHILSEITRTCDRVLIIDKGKLVAEGAESELHARAAKSMRLVCEVERADAALRDKVAGVSGVASVTLDEAASRLTIETTQDVRAAVARVVVESGAGLVGLAKAEAGLEAIFMGLVRNSGGQA